MEARLIDVREYPEFAEGHIEGSELVPLGILDKASEGWDRSAPLTLVCRSGTPCGRCAANPGGERIHLAQSARRRGTSVDQQRQAAHGRPEQALVDGASGAGHGGRFGADILRDRAAYIEEILCWRGCGRCGPRLRGSKRYLHDGLGAWPHAMERSGESKRMTPLAIGGGLVLSAVIGIISGMIGIGGAAFLIPALIFSTACHKKPRRVHPSRPCCCPSASSPSGLTTRPGMSI